MRRVLTLLTILAWVSLAGTTQTALIVLNPVNWQPGHLPDGWQVKVNRGTPKIATVREGNSNYLDLKSHDSSFGLEREVLDTGELVPFSPGEQLKVTRRIGLGGGLIFKGSGFYETDYRSENYKAAAKKDLASQTPAKTDTKAGTSTGSAPAKSAAPRPTSAPWPAKWSGR